MSETKEQTVRDAIERQKRRLRADDKKVRTLESFLHSGDVGAQLTRLSDKQIGQLMFDFIGNEFCFGAPEASILHEATERLLRSSAGGRGPTEVFNDVGALSTCPVCGADMMRFVGIDEPDYRECVSTKCGYRIVDTK